MHQLWKKSQYFEVSPPPSWNASYVPEENFLPFSSNLKLSSANSFSLEESKIYRLISVNTSLPVFYTKQDITYLWIHKILFVFWRPESSGELSIYIKMGEKFQPMSACAPRAGWYRMILFKGAITHSHTMTPFDAPGKQAFKKHWVKEKLLVTSNFSFSLKCFLHFWITFCHFRQIWNCHLQTLSVWKSLKFVVW